MNPSRILVVDDERAMQHMIATVLRSKGYEVLCAGDAETAIEMAQRHPPCLMLLDVHMPAGDGFSIQTRLGKIPALANVPTIYVTGDLNHGVADRADHLHAAAMIFKPFELEELVETVREVLGAAQPAAVRIGQFRQTLPREVVARRRLDQACGIVTQRGQPRVRG